MRRTADRVTFVEGEGQEQKVPTDALRCLNGGKFSNGAGEIGDARGGGREGMTCSAPAKPEECAGAATMVSFEE